MEYRDRTFTKESILLDGNVFSGCTFVGCVLIYKGIAPVGMSACLFNDGTQWAFDGPAGLTIDMMAGLYRGAGDYGRNVIEKTFDMIRLGNPNQEAG